MKMELEEGIVEGWRGPIAGGQALGGLQFRWTNSSWRKSGMDGVERNGCVSSFADWFVLVAHP